ncbi:hypothetical protein SAMN04487936_101555 [Halobacillus dabanensis]|uniref:Uncharacterized protein n=1 Tax=Halobacillus dabanensis TaxID=240302 RepID=A0A1I3Q6L1_HALDA|nr:hypothetical protein [Halobacillus dabanensis]SFJ29222.1 hypothetical protein SAMN04487936_101555 [Halobacillus dabanensis]
MTNRFFLLFGAMMVLLFGGVFVIRYFRTGELLADQLIGVAVGAIVFIWAFIWRQRNKIRE